MWLKKWTIFLKSFWFFFCKLFLPAISHLSVSGLLEIELNWWKKSLVTFSGKNRRIFHKIFELFSIFRKIFNHNWKNYKKFKFSTENQFFCINFHKKKLFFMFFSEKLFYMIYLKLFCGIFQVEIIEVVYFGCFVEQIFFCIFLDSPQYSAGKSAFCWKFSTEKYFSSFGLRKIFC